MAKFRQRVQAAYVIYVEADDQYKADELIRNMSDAEFLSKAHLDELYQWDTDEFPEDA